MKYRDPIKAGGKFTPEEAVREMIRRHGPRARKVATERLAYQKTPDRAEWWRDVLGRLVRLDEKNAKHRAEWRERP